MQVPEHTWGVDTKIYLGDYSSWTNAQLQAQIAAHQPNYTYTIDAWIRQRSYTRWALEALDAGLVSYTFNLIDACSGSLHALHHNHFHQHCNTRWTLGSVRC